MKNCNLQGKTVLVTGASSGLGEALCVELIHQGAKVVGVARNQDAFLEITQNLGENFSSFVCDVACRQDVAKLFVWMKEKDLFPDIFSSMQGLQGTLLLKRLDLTWENIVKFLM